MSSTFVSLKSLFFIFFLSIILLCQFLLGETYLGILTGGSLFLFLTFFLTKLDFGQLRYKSNVFIVLIWIAYLGFVVIATFFTHSLPLSLQSIFFSFLYFFVFVFFLTVSFDFLDRSLLFSVLILIAGVLIALSSFIRIHSDWAFNLPGMNFIYETYGHNHLASYIILINPLILLMDFRESRGKKEKSFRFAWLEKHKFLFIYGLFNLFLLTTFARVAIMIGFLQLLYVIFFLQKAKSKSSFKKILLFMLGILYVGIISTKLFFSVVQIVQPSFKCTFLQDKLCKNIGADLRIEYWKQSLKSLKDNPLTGYGPGTFQLISNKYKSSPYAYTLFSHNAFLQVLCESGIFAGATFFLIFFYFFYKSLRHLRYFLGQFSEVALLVLALVSTTLDSLFDFSWSFSGLFFIVVLLMAFILREVNKIQDEKINIEKLKVPFKGFLGVMILLMGVYWVGYIVNEILISQNRVSNAFQIAPFYYYERNSFLKNKQLDTKQITFFHHIYENDPDIYSIDSEDLKNVNSLHDRNSLFFLDPWKVVFSSVNNSNDLKSLGFSSDTVFRLLQFILENEKNSDIHVLSYEQKRALAAKTLNFADELLQSGNTQEAGKLYVLAYSFEGYSVQDHQILISIKDSDLDQFLSEVNQISAANFGVQNDFYSTQYYRLARIELENNQFDQFQKNIVRIIDVSPEKTNFFWLAVSKEIQVKLDKFLAVDDKTKAKELVEAWENIRKFSAEKKLHIDFEPQALLARYLIQIGNKDVNENFGYLANNYQTALDIYPGVFDEKIPHFLDEVNLSVAKPEDAQKYFDLFDKYYPQVTGGRNSKSYELLLKMSLNLYQSGDLVGAQKYLALADRLAFSDSAVLDEFIKSAQSMAEDYTDRGQLNEALKILKFMNILRPNDFWIVQQPGNLYLQLGNNSEMESEYAYCSAHYPYPHEDCVNKGYGDKDRFKKVGLIIKGEKTWQEVLQ